VAIIFKGKKEFSRIRTMEILQFLEKIHWERGIEKSFYEIAI